MTRNRLAILSRHLDLTAPTRQMTERLLLKEGILLKAKSGRRLRGFLCSDIMVLTDDAAKTLYRMVNPISSSALMVAYRTYISPFLLLTYR
jgi:hypothetical protein